LTNIKQNLHPLTNMKILDSYTQAQGQHFDNDLVSKVTGRVVIGKDDGANNFCMRVFTVAPGGHTPRHSHAWEHEVLIHEGRGEVFANGRWTTIKRGSVVFIPGNEEHQFRNPGDTDLVFACLIPQGVPEL
jgi:quercetin dioxygenase-like cupin family protein